MLGLACSKITYYRIKLSNNIVWIKYYYLYCYDTGAGLLRQATYTTTRLGIFKIFNDLLTKYNKGKHVPLY